MFHFIRYHPVVCDFDHFWYELLLYNDSIQYTWHLEYTSQYIQRTNINWTNTWMTIFKVIFSWDGLSWKKNEIVIPILYNSRVLMHFQYLIDRYTQMQFHCSFNASDVLKIRIIVVALLPIYTKLNVYYFSVAPSIRMKLNEMYIEYIALKIRWAFFKKISKCSLTNWKLNLRSRQNVYVTYQSIMPADEMKQHFLNSKIKKQMFYSDDISKALCVTIRILISYLPYSTFKSSHTKPLHRKIVKMLRKTKIHYECTRFLSLTHIDMHTC